MDKINTILTIALVLFLGGLFMFLFTGPELTGSFIGVEDGLVEAAAPSWNLTISESLTLDKDYIFFNQNGIKFDEDDINLDCNNHKLILNNGDKRKAISLNDRDEITIENCIFINWTHSAINAGGLSDDSTIQNNRFENNERSITFEGNDSEILDNLIVNGGGIILKIGAHRTLIKNNTITVTDSDRYGLLLNSENNTVKYNTIEVDGGKDCIRIANNSKGNEIYYNNIILINGDNTAKDRNSESNQNIWDDSFCAGNYWNDYSGNGTYDIDNGKGIDNYPLINEWPSNYDTNNNGIADCKDCKDLDGDMFNSTGYDCGILDCNDSNADICPGALEVCDNIDNDCNGQTDEDLNETQSCGLGICSEGLEIRVCSAGVWGNWSECSTANLTTNEICDDGIDNDCDGTIDEDCSVPYVAPTGSRGSSGGGGGGGSAPIETTIIEEGAEEEETTETALVTGMIPPANIPPITARAVANTVKDNKWPVTSALVVSLMLAGLFIYNNPKMFKNRKRKRKRRR